MYGDAKAQPSIIRSCNGKCGQYLRTKPEDTKGIAAVERRPCGFMKKFVASTPRPKPFAENETQHKSSDKSQPLLKIC